jgi:hypothetical protein
MPLARINMHPEGVNVPPRVINMPLARVNMHPER